MTHLTSLTNLRKALFFLALHFLNCPTISQENKSARIEKIGKDVYAIMHENATDQWPHGNTGVIVGNDAVMVIDACYLPSMAKEDIRLISTVTDKPVKYLAFTHWHFDHTNGTIVYKETFPSIQIISEKESRKFIELNAGWWAKMCTAQGSAKRKSVEELEAILRNQKDTAGKEMTEAEMEEARIVIEKRKKELDELAGLKVIEPDRVFEGSLMIDLGNRKVEIIDRGRANSPHDVTFYLREDQILFTGDILVQSPLPYLAESWPVHWVKVLEQIESTPIKAMVMGHGPVQYDHNYTKQVREYLEAILQKVEKLIREGKTLNEVKQSVKMDEFKKGIWLNESDADWQYNLNSIIERAWKGIRGQGG